MNRRLLGFSPSAESPALPNPSAERNRGACFYCNRLLELDCCVALFVVQNYSNCGGGLGAYDNGLTRLGRGVVKFSSLYGRLCILQLLGNLG